jgi:hypothetical protein
MKKPIIFLAFANDNENREAYLRNLIKEKNQIISALKPIEGKLCEYIVLNNASIKAIFNTFQENKNRIAIFHFSGHASSDALMLEDENGDHGYADSAGMTPFLARQQGLKLVFLNGCATEEQAKEMMEMGVPMVIGTSKSINDETASKFSTRFYDGIAKGQPLEKAWKDAIDLVKTTKKGTKKLKGLKLRRDGSSDFPWRRWIRRGSEAVKEWNLPLAAKNPLFGLPDLPATQLPERPFVFLRPYSKAHAQLFFGRGQDIRALYNRVIDEQGAPVILLYGQSGAGKSSLLDAGLLPRLENSLEHDYQVIYLRRNAQNGLLATLDTVWESEDFVPFVEQKAVEISPNLNPLYHQLNRLNDLIDNADKSISTLIQEAILKTEKQIKASSASHTSNIVQQKTRRDAWISMEKNSKKTFLIIMDQVEEVFTRGAVPNHFQKDELHFFLEEIKGIFNNPQNSPKGKLILSYRKEYHPEIEELSKNLELARETLFLKHLNRDGIIEIVLGLESTPALKAKYQVKVDASSENNLSVIIADDLLEDKKSAIAPTIQILLSKMWDLEEAKANRLFSTDNYQHLKSQGILMEDFYQQQIQTLTETHSEWVESGLVLDLLNLHVTDANTSGVIKNEVILSRYRHIDYIESTMQQLKDLYLLASVGKNTSLAHDTLAPVIRKAFNTSFYPGQIANKILTFKQMDINNPNTVIYPEDLKKVLEGQKGMRCWSEQEVQLLQRSKAKKLIDLANTLINTNTHDALLLAKMAWSIQPTPEVKRVMAKALYQCFDEEGILHLNESQA